MVAIADLAGGKWPSIARTSLTSLCIEAQHSDDSIGVRLLADIRKVFGTTGDRIPSVDLIEELVKLEDAPWAEHIKGEKPITPVKLAGILKRYEIGPHTVRDGDKRFKGYERSDFTDTWTRYLPLLPGEAPQAVTRLQPNAGAVNVDAACHRVTVRRPSAGTVEGFSLEPQPEEGEL